MASVVESRVALVTGGSKRVGRAIALRMGREGFDIAFTYLSSKEEAESLVAEISGVGRRSIAIMADLTQPAAAAETIYKQVTQFAPRLDVLVNNASLYEKSALLETDLAQLRRLWAIHVESPLMLCRAFYEMLKAASGHVVNMVDLMAERPRPEFLGYCASKGGLATLTLGLARELAPYVTVNGIAPGVVAWPEDVPAGQREKYLSRVPLGRAGTPEDVAEAVSFLCGGGKYMTGQILRLDGGRSIT
ncbi:MAG: SDR family oxidoreductase [Planctomycetota bacterium]|nr:SDR family oxidoreductase [Planctomycetota bacterium]